MFNSNFATYPYVSPIHTYSENLGRAARRFIAALLAIDPARVEAATGDAVTSEDNSLTADELSRLAREFDAFMPNQAAELRYLAGRD